MKGYSLLVTLVLYLGETEASAGLRIKWCFLRNAKLLYYGGLTWILLFPLYLIVLPLLLGITSMIAIPLSLVMLVAAAIVCITYYYVKLYRVVEGLSAPFTVEDIDLLHVRIALSDGVRVYTIEFHELPEAPDYYTVRALPRRLPPGSPRPSDAFATKDEFVICSSAPEKTTSAQMGDILKRLGKHAHDIDLWGYGGVRL